MKLVCLNAWGGTHYEPLMQFIRAEAPTADIFCFQEISLMKSGARTTDGHPMNLFADLTDELGSFQGFFAPMQETNDFWNQLAPPGLVTGNAIFVHNNIAVNETDIRFVHKSYNEMVFKGSDTDWPAAFQCAYLSVAGRPLAVVNIHAISWPGSKLDTPERIKQSEEIIAFLAAAPGEKVLCGDFNLMPETESIAILERSGLRNLIKEFKITETRGPISHARYPDDPQHFADFTFTSPGITVTHFSVPNVAVSDHMPMILEFSLS